MSKQNTAAAIAADYQPHAGIRFTIVPDVVEKYYLRKMTVSVRSPRGKSSKLTFYVFYNYRGTLRGTVATTNRTTAKRLIRKDNQAAEFFR